MAEQKAKSVKAGWSERPEKRDASDAGCKSHAMTWEDPGEMICCGKQIQGQADLSGGNYC